MPRILHVKDLREMSLGERFLIFFFVVFPGNHTAANCITYGNARTGRKFVRPVVVEMMRNLVAAQVLAPGLAAKGVTDEAYRLSALFTAKALHLLAREAAKQGWWPTVETLAQGTPGDWMGAQLAYAIRNFVDPLHIWQIAETMKALLVGGTCVFGGLPKGVHYPLVSVHWSAVGHVLRLLAPQEEVPVEDLPAQGSELVLPVLFELGFLQGADLRPALTAARTLLGQVKTRVSVSTFCAFCALAVWTGQRDVLNGAASLVAPGSPAERFAALCLDVFEGRFAEAEKAFAAGADSFRGVFSTDVSTPVWLLGIALALRQDAPLTRVSKYAKQLKQEPTALLNWHPVARDQLQGIAHRRTALVERLMEAGSSAWSPHAASDGGDAFVEARNLFLSGYPALAAILLAGVRRQAPEREGLDEFEKVLAAAGTVTLVKGVETEPKWKTALRALSERLPDAAGAAKGEATLNGTIGWQLALVPAARDQQWTCSALTPVYRGPRAAEDGRDDRRLTLKGLAGTKYRACLTSCDAEVLQVLLKNGYNPRIPNSVPEEALSLLCGHPRLVQTWAFVENEKMAPMELVRARCPLTTAKTAAGGMQLRLPDWLLDNTEQASVLFSSAQGRFQYYPLSKRVRDIAAIFAEQGVAGALEIPAEGVAEAQRLLVRLAGELAVAGDFAPDEAGDLAQVQGCTMPHVRLVYTNEALSLALVVEPIANRAVAVCEPGIGLAQRLVQLRGGRTVLLVRDLAAEEAAASAVRTALESFDAWATAKNRWLISEPGAALEALRTLTALGGVQLDWPEGKKVRVTAPKKGGVSISASGEDWFGINGEVKLDDGRVLQLIDLLHALANREGNFVRFSEKDYVYLSNELLRRLDALAAAVGSSEQQDAPGLSPAALPMLAKAFDGADEEADMPALPVPLAARAAEIEAAFAAKVEIPRRFKGTLRPYQEAGYVWLAHLAACGFGACLADDMGLGKTIQIIALLLARAAEGPSLVVAPASVCRNWEREMARFAPTLRVILPGEGDEKELPALGEGDVVVASYGLLVARDAAFTAPAWNGVVLDEAQAIKNAETQRAQIARRLKARFRVAATGTPVENGLVEFASIFAFLNPGLLGRAKDFESRFVEAGFATPALKRLVEPFVLRRLKRDVLKDLPEKTEVTLRVTLGEEERAAYEACRKDALASLQEKGETANRISVLAALTRLRRYCCHPSLVFPDATLGAKLDAVLELLGQLREAGHRALVFSQFVDFLTLVREAVAARGWTVRYLDGSTPTATRAQEVDAFQRGNGDFFLISLKAGGVGLNLTAANYVLLLDPWWNPAVEDQAADRAHRIGQRLPVTVYRIVAADTVEERILDLHGTKRAVGEDLLEGANGVPLSTDLLLSLFN